jgi:hypothetical protein
VVVPAASVARVPEGTSLEAAATLPMNGLTVRLALDRLALQPGQTLGVTGAAGAVGGYAVELGVSDGLRVIAVAGLQDAALVKRFGASSVVPRGDAAIRGLHDAAPGGVDGLIDAAVLDAAVLPAIRDGGKLATVRGFAGPSERGITIEPVRVTSYLHNHEALDRLGHLVAERQAHPARGGDLSARAGGGRAAQDGRGRDPRAAGDRLLIARRGRATPSSRMRAPRSRQKKFDLLRHDRGAQLDRKGHEVRVGKHRLPVKTTVGVIVELPQMNELVQRADIALEIPDEVLGLSALLECRITFL